MSWAQNKGKEVEKIAKSKLDEIGPYYISRKLDGHYTQIVYDGVEVKFFTSGGKEFYIHNMAYDIKESNLPPFAIECEYLYNCNGKLGDRGKSARLTTYRTDFLHGISTKGNPYKDTFVILDILAPELFDKRLNMIREWFDGALQGWFFIPTQELGDLSLGKRMAHLWVNKGYEGAMLKHFKQEYKQGKRTNDIIKIKPRKTADLLCIGIKEGEGKYEGMIGSLVLQDSEHRVVYVGSGLSDELREMGPEEFVGLVIEIEYEQLLDTYIQPVFKEIRYDKNEEEID